MLKLTKIIAITFFFVTITSSANDSAGTVASGGITFTKMPNISMLREELTISPYNIKVVYLFKNNSDQDITTPILFPIPPYTGMGPLRSWDTEVVGTSQKSPYLNFSVKAQNQPVEFKTDTRAIMNGADITQQLKDANIPLNPYIVQGSLPVTDGSSTKVTYWQNKAKQLNLVDAAGKPKWQKQVTFYWTQTFPAHKLVLIEQQYRPSPGAFLSSMKSNSLNAIMAENMQQVKAIFGMDLDSLHGNSDIKNWLVQQAQQTNQSNNNASAYFYNVNYILKTGANWAGPIKHFVLKINKPESGAIAYNDFYGKEVATKTVSPKQLKIFIEKFTPRKDLQVLFVTNTSIY